MKLKVFKRKKKICRCVKAILEIVGLCLFLHLAGIEGGILNGCITLGTGIGQAIKTVGIALITYAVYRLTEYIEHDISLTRIEYRRAKK